MIAFEAVPFGFGPVAKLLAIAEGFNGECETTFVGSGCSLALATDSQCFDRIMEVDTLKPEEHQETLARCLRGCTAVVSVMDPAFAAWTIARGLRTVVVDSLFWMWDRIPEPWHRAHAVVLQRFDGVEQRVESELCRPRARVVGPILSPKVGGWPQQEGQSNTLLINLGGAEDPISTDSFLCARSMTHFLAQLDVLETFGRKVLTVGPRQRGRLMPLAAEGLEVLTLDHDAFLQELAGAQVLCTTPGLTVTFESFALGVPCVFLPPFNYSQFLNLLAFRENEAAPLGIHWKDYGVAGSIHAGMEEGVAVRQIETCIARAVQHPPLRFRIRKDLSGALAQATEPATASSMRAAQNRYFQRLGGLGTAETVAFILEVLHG